MNDLKNFAIFILSAVVLIQSFFLFHLLSRRSQRAPVSVAREARLSARRPAAQKPAAPREKPVPPVAPAPEARPKPARVLGRIVLVLDDWGYNLRHKDFIADDDLRFTLSILPFKDYSSEVAELARAHNKEVIIHMPMEPHDKENYGLERNTLLTSMGKKTVLRLLDAAFENVPYAKGMSNHMGSRATEDLRLMRIVMEYLKNKGVFFLDSLVTPKTVAAQAARSAGVAFSHRDTFIDNDDDPGYIRGQMRDLCAKARSAGVAVGIGHDRPATIAVLAEMIPELEKEGYQFINLSEAVSKNNAYSRD